MSSSFLLPLLYIKGVLYMKKWKMAVALLALSSLLLAGCGNGEKSAGNTKEIPELKIAISPYQDAETIQTKTEPLGKMLQAK